MRRYVALSRLVVGPERSTQLAASATDCLRSASQGWFRPKAAVTTVTGLPSTTILSDLAKAERLVEHPGCLAMLDAAGDEWLPAR